MASSADRGLAFYADHDFSSNLIALLRRHGADVLMAQQDGYDQRPDPTVMDRATELGRVLLSHDKHMLAEAHRRQQAGQRCVRVWPSSRSWGSPASSRTV
ncbi:MAG: DUF5615 family PIN-like protein [Armatimonadetes bacterium]|nr:DUF5615 family PIN-like protein [Armatimonadota bacterium]